MPGDMHSLLAKYFSGQASAEETVMVQNWAGSSEENAADFKLLQNMWDRSGDEEQQDFDAEKAWQFVDGTLQKAEQPKLIRLLSRRSMVAAAAIILLLGAWWIFAPAGPAHTITADIAMKEVDMQDGSKIYLRQGASIEYGKGYGSKNRDLVLIGEAFFEVKPNASLPFTIAAANTKVQVVGTSFLVNTNNGQVALFVRTGQVSFSAAAEKTLVVAGENALYASNRLTKGINTRENFDAWRTRQLIFDKTLLKEALSDIGNYYNISITLKQGDGSQMDTTRVTARFNDQSLQAVLDELSLISTFQVRKLNDTQYEISLK